RGSGRTGKIALLCNEGIKVRVSARKRALRECIRGVCGYQYLVFLRQISSAVKVEYDRLENQGCVANHSLAAAVISSPSAGTRSWRETKVISKPLHLCLRRSNG